MDSEWRLKGNEANLQRPLISHSRAEGLSEMVNNACNGCLRLGGFRLADFTRGEVRSQRSSLSHPNDSWKNIIADC